MTPRDIPADDDSTSRTPARRPYTKPQLQVYGDLAEITKAVLGSKTNDGAGHPNRHFTS
jgi:hypothetical protein